MENDQRSCFGLIGLGAFGSALKFQVEQATGQPALAWVRSTSKYPSDCRISSNPVDLEACQNLIYAAKAQAFPQVLDALLSASLAEKPLLIAAKGLLPEPPSLLCDYARASGWQGSISVLSGPGFAKDIKGSKPFAVTIANQDKAAALKLCAQMASPTFRPYASADPVGASVGGALKNPVAIACGMAMGLGLGVSSRAALMTRGLAEIQRLGCAIGGRTETFLGLSGVGDLALTCTSDLSRNYQFGFALGQGETPITAQKRIGTVEGIETAHAAVALADQHGVEAPICAQLAAVLTGSITMQDAIGALLSRSLSLEV